MKSAVAKRVTHMRNTSFRCFILRIVYAPADTLSVFHPEDSSWTVPGTWHQRCFDTEQGYGYGHSQRILSVGLRRRRPFSGPWRGDRHSTTRGSCAAPVGVVLDGRRV